MSLNSSAAQLRESVTGILNSHDLLGVLDLGAPADEYDPEMEDFAQLLAAGEPITPEVVACVWHKWFGDPSEQPGPVTPKMEALAFDLQALSPFAEF
ncbi:hypothetical protein B1A87_003090 [Arthrobacter sp. KBS0703]|uniref:hypothetical protein n=1 Tax=Arthrobacter sp. KBS0703 TaxID=1955698 RepID=UPI00098FFE10|nr:hypothetical protein [Arthrobacter sp. KBS0703]TSE15050.1 hypothetical protein B1A87_003090 [Arthrobacter sp. KBS0703]